MKLGVRLFGNTKRSRFLPGIPKQSFEDPEAPTCHSDLIIHAVAQ